MSTKSPTGTTSYPKTIPPNLSIQQLSTTILASGVLSAYPPLSIPTFNISTFPSILHVARFLDPTHRAAKTLLDIHHLLVGKWDAEASYGFSDIIGLASPVLRARGSTATRIPVPTPCYTSIISSTEGFVVFHHCLADYITERESRGEKVSAQINWILQSYESLSSRFPEWQSEILANDPHRPRDLAFLEAVHDAWDTCTAYFVSLTKEGSKSGVKGLRYYDLMASHVTQAVNWWSDAWSAVCNEKCHPTLPGLSSSSSDLRPLRALEAEGMHLYFSYLPLIVADMRSRCSSNGSESMNSREPDSNSSEPDSNGNEDTAEVRESEGKDYEKWEALVHEAWLTMIFHGMCWWRLHWMFEGEKQVYGVCKVEAGNAKSEEREEGWEIV